MAIEELFSVTIENQGSSLIIYGVSFANRTVTAASRAVIPTNRTVTIVNFAVSLLSGRLNSRYP